MNNQHQAPNIAGIGAPDQVRSNDLVNNRNQRKQGRQGRQFNRNVSLSSKSFKGETTELSGYVFQSQEESKVPSQFRRTLEAIERYSTKMYLQVDLCSLFDSLQAPVLEQPEQPMNDANDLEIALYREEVKLYVKERRALNQALRALFSVKVEGTARHGGMEGARSM